MAKAVRATSSNSEPSRYEGFETMLLMVSEDRDPYTNDVLVRIALADEQDLEDAFGAAAAVQPQWCEMLPGQRGAIIRRAVEIIDQRREEIIDWLIHESGSTRIKASVAWQYARAVRSRRQVFPRVSRDRLCPPTFLRRKAASIASRLALSA
jgi:acyl-CoA reductase-like NAD-dependent aldehyde dehydrogenase